MSGAVFQFQRQPPGDYKDNSTHFVDDCSNNLTIDPLSCFGSGMITITSATVPDPSAIAVRAIVFASLIG
jgi:hypothetical protein